MGTIILLSSKRTLIPTQAQFFRGYTAPETKIKKSIITTTNHNNLVPSPSSTCGNLICEIEQGETTDNCAIDCICNLNDVCDAWESSNSCPLDCHCGNFICDKELGENSDNCPSDCTKGCSSGEMEDNEMEMDGDGMDMGEVNIYYDMDNNMNHDMDMSNMDNMDMNMNSMMHHKNNNDGSKIAADEGDDTTCKDNGISCSNNSDCCSFACDSVCVG